MNSRIILTLSGTAALVLGFHFAASAAKQLPDTQSEALTAKGVVVAVQLQPGAARSAMNINAEPLGDFAEVWMVRVDRWFHPNKAKYILVEYTHVNRQEPFVTDSELDSAEWTFTITPVPQNQGKSCISWGERYVPTAHGRRNNLPVPKTLPCFEMRTRPVPSRGR